jgi:hypothetical protein
LVKATVKKKATVRRAKSVNLREARKDQGAKQLRPYGFQKGNPGKKPGTKNKLGVKLKEAILEAAERSGRDGKGTDGAVGYLVWLSRAEPAVFGRMLEKVMPLQLEVKDKTDRVLTAQEAVDRLKERGLPVPPTLMSLARSVGQAVAERQDEDYDAELNGEDEPDEPEEDAA